MKSEQGDSKAEKPVYAIFNLFKHKDVTKHYTVFSSLEPFDLGGNGVGYWRVAEGAALYPYEFRFIAAHVCWSR